MKKSLLEKWEWELENEDVIRLGYVIGGLPDGHYTDEDNLGDALDYAIEQFCERLQLSERTNEEMHNIIAVRDAFYRMLEREGLLKDKETKAVVGQEKLK